MGPCSECGENGRCRCHKRAEFAAMAERMGPPPTSVLASSATPPALVAPLTAEEARAFLGLDQDEHAPWEQALASLRAKGVDVDALLARAAKTCERMVPVGCRVALTAEEAFRIFRDAERESERHEDGKRTWDTGAACLAVAEEAARRERVAVVAHVKALAVDARKMALERSGALADSYHALCLSFAAVAEEIENGEHHAR